MSKTTSQRETHGAHDIDETGGNGSDDENDENNNENNEENNEDTDLDNASVD